MNIGYKDRELFKAYKEEKSQREALQAENDLLAKENSTYRSKNARLEAELARLTKEHSALAAEHTQMAAELEWLDRIREDFDRELHAELDLALKANKEQIEDLKRTVAHWKRQAHELQTTLKANKEHIEDLKREVAHLNQQAQQAYKAERLKAEWFEAKDPLRGKIRDVLLQLKEIVKCPISLEVMRRPVTLVSGHSFDAEQIMQHFTWTPTCPTTRLRCIRNTFSPFKPMPNDRQLARDGLYPSVALRQIAELVSENSELFEE